MADVRRDEDRSTADGSHEARLARGLGWASVGIGLAELAATRRVEGMLGVDDEAGTRRTLRALGLREVAHGVGILASGERDGALTAGVWSRVAGDVLDGAMLVLAARRTRRPALFALTTAAVVAIAVADVVTAVRLQRRRPARAAHRA